MTVLDQSGQLLRAAMGFGRYSMLSYDRGLWALRTWLDSWPGIGRIAVGMARSRPCAHALVSRFCFLLGSSAGLTYVDAHGAAPWIWMVASSFAIAKCGVLGGITMKLPAGRAFIPPVSN